MELAQEDAFRLAPIGLQHSPEVYFPWCRLIQRRLATLIDLTYQGSPCLWLVSPLKRQQSEWCNFLDQPEVSPDNKHAERPVRLAAIARRNSCWNPLSGPNLRPF